MRLSPRLWLASFGATSLWYLVQTDAVASRTAAGRCSPRGCTPTRSASSPSCRSCSRSAGPPFATGSTTSRSTPPRRSRAPRRILRRSCSAPPSPAPRATTARRGASSGSRSSRVRLQSSRLIRGTRLAAGRQVVRPPEGTGGDHKSSQASTRPSRTAVHGYAPNRRAARPADRGRRPRLGGRAARTGSRLLHPFHQGFWWLADRAAAARRRGRDRLRARRRAAPDRRSGGEGCSRPAEMVHWLFATGLLLLGLCLLCEGIVGEEVWRMRPWRIYLWPGLVFVMGVLMWPVMAFYTNSAIHMYAHGSWAEVLMLAGGAELGLVHGQAQDPLVAADDAVRVRRHRHRVHRPRAERAGSSRGRRSCITCSAGRSDRRGAVPARAGLLAAVEGRSRRRSRSRSSCSSAMLYTDRDVAPIFGHLSPLAGIPHR